MSERRTELMDALFERLGTVAGSLLNEATQSNLDSLKRTLVEIDQLPQDEKEKLKEKDKTLDDALNKVGKAIMDAKWMPQGTAQILLALVGVLFIVEDILKELKRLQGIK